MTGVVVVSGALANKAGSGGEAWVRLSWIRGFQQLGFDVWFVEQLAERSAWRERYFTDVVTSFGLTERAALLWGDDNVAGPRVDDLAEIAREATLVNISGHLDHARLFPLFRRRVYVDIDPGFTQSWAADGLAGARLHGHDAHYTIAERIGADDCVIPTGDVPWRTVRQPVVLADWPATDAVEPARFTTVGNWRGPFGGITIDGRSFGLKVHEFRKLIALPSRSPHVFELAVDIHPTDASDREALIDNGWRLVDPRAASADPAAFRAYVQGSGAEFSVAQGVYVGTRSGWFSDRTVRYLASGKPALVQDTGFSQTLPTGLGLMAFRTLDDAVAMADDIVARYPEHAAAARRIAVEHFGAERVLGRLCEELGVR